MQPGDVMRTWADIGLAEQELEWSPVVGIEEGLHRFLDWFQRQKG
jgi:UDP-glucuronate 4-epimerase